MTTPGPTAADPHLADPSPAGSAPAGLAPGVRPEHIEEWDEARAILPIAPLMRSLFSSADPGDTLLKLVVLFTLAQTDGRFTKERIRALVRAIEPDRLDALVRSLYDGRWLELRARDNTYRLNPLGLFLLATLRAANFASQTPANLLVRAAEALHFGARVDGDGRTTGRLLGMLLAELETQAERAREVIASGRPRQLLRFSRREVRAQLDRVTEVLALLEQRLDTASTHFERIVRLHRAMQTILRAHEGLHRRLAEWSLRRLETTDAGYSLSALCDAVMSATDDELETGRARAVHWPRIAARVSTDQILDRHTTERRARAAARAPFVYAPPPEPTAAPIDVIADDPMSRLRQAISDAIRTIEPGEPLRWGAIAPSLTDGFADAALHVALLARLHGQGRADVIRLDGMPLRIDMPSHLADLVRDLDGDAALRALEQAGVLDDLGPRGWHARITLTRLSDDR